jgi:pyruvate formate lyase activating enzyme
MLGGVPTAEHLSRAELLVGQRTGEVGMVHSWELVTAVDGPGTRMTTFLSGCPLRCLYCHNPDTWGSRGGLPVLAEDLIAQIRRYQGIFAATGGGITFSGGEALAQPAFVTTVARAAHDLGVHVALDTSGFLGRQCDDELLANLDLVLLDVKAGDETTYHRLTGGRLAPTLDFGRRVADAGVELWIRFVLVPGITDSRPTIARVADYAASLATTSRVEVLGFHQLGRDKWAELGLDYQLADNRTPTAAELAAARAIFSSRGLPTY